MSRARLKVPATAGRDEVVAIKVQIPHPMETGLRRDDRGVPIPRRIINRFVCRLNGREVFSADLSAAVAANPFLSLHLRATESGLLEFLWFDDDGTVHREEARITVR